MKRIRPIRILVVMVVLGGLAFAIFRTREPRFRDRTLTEWVRDGASALDKFRAKPNADPFHPETDPDWQAASHAVKEIGPNAIPFLLKWIEATDPPLKVKLIDWLDHHLSLHMGARTADGYHDGAQVGFWLLGNESKPAWPVLIQWTYSTDPDRRLLAFVCFAVSKPDKDTFMPVLLRLINDPDYKVQFNVSKVCAFLNPQAAEAAGVYKMYPRLQNQITNASNTNQLREK
jgi:hypothetical protein